MGALLLRGPAATARLGAVETGDAAKDREHARETGASGGSSRSSAPVSSRPQELAERVDDPVERLVRHGLALVAAPREDEGLGVAASQWQARSVDEVADEAALSDARVSPDDHHHRALAAVLEGSRQRRGFVASPDERHAPRRLRNRRGAEADDDVPAGRTRRRIELEQRLAERDQVVGRVGVARAYALRRAVRLGSRRVAAAEGQVAGQRLVKENTDAVPVGRGTHGAARGLLGRHVGAGSGAVGGDAHPGAADVDCEAEVDDDEPAARLDQDVRRLDVAMHLSRVVERAQTAGELGERLAKAIDVQLARLVLLVALVSLARVGGRRRHAARLAHAGRSRVEATGASVFEQGNAVDELHRDEPLSAVFDELEERDEVRVPDILQRPELVFQVEERVRAELRQRLERDARVLCAIERFVHGAHPSSPEMTQELEASGDGEVGESDGHRRSRPSRRRVNPPRTAYQVTRDERAPSPSSVNVCQRGLSKAQCVSGVMRLCGSAVRCDRAHVTGIRAPAPGRALVLTFAFAFALPPAATSLELRDYGHRRPPPASRGFPIECFLALTIPAPGPGGTVAPAGGVKCRVVDQCGLQL